MPSSSTHPEHTSRNNETAASGNSADSLPTRAEARTSTAPHLPRETSDDVTDVEAKQDPYEVKLESHELASSLPLLRKWLCVLVVCSCAACVTCASSMAASTFPAIEKEFNVGPEVAILSISIFILGLGIGPLVFGGLSEFIGRNLVYRGSFSAFCLLTIPVACANNIAVHLIFRFLTGFVGAAFLSVGGGSIADLFDNQNVATPVAIYSVSPFIGPVLGPMVSGFINQYTSWRWTYYVIIIWSFLQTILLFLIPETYAPTLTNRKATRLRKETGDQQYFSKFDTQHRSILLMLRTSIARPFQLIVHEMMLLSLNIWFVFCDQLMTSLELAIVYVTFSQFSVIFGDLYGFSVHEVGLSFLGLGLGMGLATSSQPIWNAVDRRVARHFLELGQQVPPEYALFPAMAAAVLAPIGLFAFAFTLHSSVHWSVPIIVIFPFGTSVVLSFTSTFRFLVQTYRPIAASALASNSFMRSCLAGALPVVSRPMFRTMTNTGALGLLAGIMVLLAPLPFVFFRFGPRIRRNSKYAV